MTKEISIRYDYTATPEVMKLVKDFDLIITDQSFEETSLLTAEFKIAIEERLIERLSLSQSMGAAIDWTV